MSKIEQNTKTNGSHFMNYIIPAFILVSYNLFIQPILFFYFYKCMHLFLYLFTIALINLFI